jgi:hypothetical protein
MKKLSGFDLGMIIAFVVVTLLGIGAWWYLSGQLTAAQTDVTNAKADYDRYSVAKGGQDSIIVNPQNGQTLQANIDLLNAQLNPLIASKLLPKDNKLKEIANTDPVAWKHQLDDDVQKLTAAAKVRGVSLPPSFYFGFTRYLSQSPNDQQTAVLSKQLLAVDEIATILINAPVKAISSVRRTYEEDSRPTGNFNPSISTTEPDHLGGYSINAPGNVYTAYPFEFDFETTTENLRTIMDSLIQSPYIFVVRSLTVENTIPNSPTITSLDTIAATPAPSSLTDSSPGEVASTTSTLGPQHLFGYDTLRIRARIDLIQWNEAP